MPTISQLRHTTMTAVVNEIKSPNSFLKNLLWPREQKLFTEVAELATVDNTREIAPFIRRGGEAMLVGGHTRTLANLETPNIRLKRAFESSELVWGRQPGNVIFASQAEIRAAVSAYMARELKILDDMIVNCEEYMCSQILQGGISYSVEGGDAFTATVPRSGSRSTVASTFWDQASPTPHADLHTMKELQAADSQPAPTIAICGSEAAATLIALAEGGTIKLTNRDGTLDAGRIELQNHFTAAGAIYLGRLSGIDFWEYNRTATLNGVSVDMIRPKYIELVNPDNALSDRVMYYGAIDDVILEGGTLARKRFAKSWKREDPSALFHLEASRPLPWSRRANATISLKVVSG